MQIDTTAANPRVLIIVLNWNGLQDTLACLASLAHVTYPSSEILLVDNGSSDNSAAVVRAAHPQVRVLESGQNLGFVGGNNLGLEYAAKTGVEYALLLNNDTEVAPKFLDHMVRVMQSAPDVGIVGPSIYYYDQPGTFWSAGGSIDWKRGLTAMIGLDQPDNGQFGDVSYAVDFVTGCALLIKMAAVRQAGMLDPRFFAYYEETEWCVRVQRSGWRILIAPQAKVWHKISPQAREASPTVHYYMTRNRLLFLKLTNASLAARLAALTGNARTLLSWTVRPRWRGKAPQRRAMIQAINDYRRGRFGKAQQVGRA